MPATSIQINSLLTRAFNLLDRREKRQSFLLLLFIMLNSLFELFGLAFIIPVISVAAEPNTIESSTFLHSVYNYSQNLGINSPSDFIVLMSLALIFIFFLKGGVGLLVNYGQAKFSFGVAHRLSGNMWTLHMGTGMENFSTSTSGQLITEINNWPTAFANTYMIGGLMVLSESIMAMLVFSALLLYNPAVFLPAIAIVVAGGILIRRLAKDRLDHISAVRKKLEPNSNTLIGNAIRGFIEIIAFEAEETLKKKYLSERLEIYDTYTKTTLLNLVPSRLFEILAVCAIGITIIFVVGLGKGQAQFLETLSVLSICAYRMMPSMSRVSSSILQMHGQKHILTAMEDGAAIDLEETQTKDDVPITPGVREKFELKTIDLYAGYTKPEKNVIAGFNVQFHKGSLSAICGESGSGKTTLINTIIGLLPPIEGKVVIEKESEVFELTKNTKPINWLSHFAYQAQQPFLFNGTLSENILMGSPDSSLNTTNVENLVRRLRLQQILGDSPLEYEISEGGKNLSGGQQQRIALLRTLHSLKPIIILDEATSALDRDMKIVVLEILREQANQGRTILLVTHDSLIREQCDYTIHVN